jgi:putative restriction endonuclease
MVQGAHIVPVGNSGLDDITNGIALCSDHHVAYDKGIIYIDPEYYIHLDDKKIDEIKSRSLDGGLDKFKLGSRIGERIRLPADSRYWPNRDYIRERMKQYGQG